MSNGCGQFSLIASQNVSKISTISHSFLPFNESVRRISKESVNDF